MTRFGLFLLYICFLGLSYGAPSENVCEPGETSKRGSCWDCDCHKGIPRCVTHCHGEDYEDIECTPGEKFYMDCNHCVCGRDLIPECSKVFCVPRGNNTKERQRRETATTTQKPTCEPGEKIDRGKCWDCDCFNGKHRCVPHCHGQDYEDIECTPGEKFYIECNFCVCGRDLIPECSRKACQSDADRFHNITKSRPQPSDGSECPPGSVWKGKCEDCICLSDGRKSCTKTCV